MFWATNISEQRAVEQILESNAVRIFRLYFLSGTEALTNIFQTLRPVPLPFISAKRGQGHTNEILL